MLQSLHVGTSNFVVDPNSSSHAFSVEMQRELAKFNATFDQKSWETLTLGYPKEKSVSFGKEGLSFTQQEEQEHRFLEVEEVEDKQRNET